MVLVYIEFQIETMTHPFFVEVYVRQVHYLKYRQQYNIVSDLGNYIKISQFRFTHPIPSELLRMLLVNIKTVNDN